MAQGATLENRRTAVAPDISGGRTTRGGERRSGTSVPAARAQLVPASRPPKSAGLLLPDICGSTTRGERRGRTPVPTACARLAQYNRSPAESRHAAFAIARLSGSARCKARPLNRCRRILAAERCRESGAAEHLRPLSTHNLPSIASRPPKFVGLLSPNIGDRTTRGENGAAERLYPLPTHDLSDIASCPPKAAGSLPSYIRDGRTTRGGERRSRASMPAARARLVPQYSQPASEICRTAVAGYLRQHNTGRATQQNVCTYYGLPDIVGRPPKSAGLLPPDIGGRTTRGGEWRSRASMLVARAQLAQYNRPTIGWFVPPCSNPIAAVLAS